MQMPPEILKSTFFGKFGHKMTIHHLRNCHRSSGIYLIWITWDIFMRV